MTIDKKPLGEKLEERYVVDPETGCWQWTGHVMANGYGSLTQWGVGSQLAHRLSYEVHVGPIPESLVIDHLCRNRACINPEHLEPVTQSENVLRGQNIGAPRKSHCKQGHPLEGANVYIAPNGDRACRPCRNAAADRYRKRQRSQA